MVGPALIVLIGIILFGSLLLVVARLIWKAQRSHGSPDEEEDTHTRSMRTDLEEKLVPAFMIFAGTSREELIDLLKHATYIDRRRLHQAAELIFQELCHLQSVGGLFAAARLPTSIMRGGLYEAMHPSRVIVLCRNAMATIVQRNEMLEARLTTRDSRIRMSTGTAAFGLHIQLDAKQNGDAEMLRNPSTPIEEREMGPAVSDVRSTGSCEAPRYNVSVHSSNLSV
ncbi:unnamed protein product [Prorocentrum cordatum]|uniref:Uncharacterized protein n=1 Tax=Prorocentrum cordatum TaxID=2364126 RepID=A0ABN9RD44_9DINO|nr:unnamed protein product [Polarella glacialis]